MILLLLKLFVEKKQLKLKLILLLKIVQWILVDLLQRAKLIGYE